MPKAITHPAFAALLAESKRTGLPSAFKRDLEVHDRKWVTARDPKLSFLWALRPDGTHVVGLEPGSDRRSQNSAPQIFQNLAEWDDVRFYIWNGITLQAFESTEAARAGMLDLIEREEQHACDLAARFCQSNPSTPHEWRGGKCTFCEVPKP